jgi:uncharacterized protein YfbU (UPF0304 family)
MDIKSLTLVERAILANQYKLFSMLDKKNAKEHLANAQIFEYGYTGLYEEALEHISDEISKEVCDETNDILVMFKHIHKAINGLSKEQRNKLELHKIRFDGFDADNDEHYYFAKFMIRKKHFYEHFSSAKMNSGSLASLPRYRKMLPVYKLIIDKPDYSFGKRELKRLIEAVRGEEH